VNHPIFSHQFGNEFIAKIGTSITDDYPWHPEMTENIFFLESYHIPMVICLSWNGFYPFGHVIYYKQYVLVSKRIDEFAYEVHTPTIKDFKYANRL